MTLRAGDIVAALGGELLGDPQRVIKRLAPLAAAQPGEMSYLADARLTHALQGSEAGCVIVAPAMRDAAVVRGDCIVTDDPHL